MSPAAAAEKPEVEAERLFARLRAGARDEATRALEALSQRAPACFAAHYYLGIARGQARAFERARASFLSALQLDPRSAPALHALAMTHVAEGSPDTAAPYLERAIEFDPHHVDSFAALAELLLAKKQAEAAKVLIAEGLRLNPGAAELQELSREL